MAFDFEIASVTRLPGAKIAAIEGRVLSGSISSGKPALLSHGGELVELTIKGVALGIGARTIPGSLTLSVRLAEPAMALAQPGDRLRWP